MLRHLHVQRLVQTVHCQRRLLVPHRVQVFADGFAFKNVFPTELEPDVGIAGA